MVLPLLALRAVVLQILKRTPNHEPKQFSQVWSWVCPAANPTPQRNMVLQDLLSSSLAFGSHPLRRGLGGKKFQLIFFIIEFVMGGWGGNTSSQRAHGGCFPSTPTRRTALSTEQALNPNPGERAWNNGGGRGRIQEVIFSSMQIMDIHLLIIY